MTTAETLAGDLIDEAADTYLTSGGVIPYVYLDADSRYIAKVYPPPDTGDLVAWAAHAIALCGAAINADCVAFVSEYWWKGYSADERPDGIDPGQLERDADADPTIGTAVIATAATRAGDTAVRVAIAHVDDDGSRRLTITPASDTTAFTGHAPDTFADAARTLDQLPTPPADADPIPYFRAACKRLGAEGLLGVAS